MFYCTNCKKYINGRVSSNGYSLVCEDCGYDTIVHEDTWRANFEKPEQRLGGFMKTFDSLDKKNHVPDNIPSQLSDKNKTCGEQSYRSNIVIGTLMIILGILTLVATYKYVVPTGSMILIASGIFIIIIRKHIKIQAT